MAEAPEVDGTRKRPKTGGRAKGTPNKATADVRAAMARFAEEGFEGFMLAWQSIDDPGEKANVYLRALEYHVPKLNRTIFTGGMNNEPIRVLVEGVPSPIVDSYGGTD